MKVMFSSDTAVGIQMYFLPEEPGRMTQSQGLLWAVPLVPKASSSVSRWPLG